jgi:predicted transcriptional regulator
MGPVPEGLKVLHRCDVRHCVNPSHLEVGTQRKNIQDAVLRRRVHGPITFSWETIQALRKRSQAGLRQADLGQEFGMSQSHVSRLLNRRQRRWREEGPA